MSLKIQLRENSCWYDLISLNPIHFRADNQIQPIVFNSIRKAESALDQLVESGCNLDDLRCIACQNPRSRPRIYPVKFKNSMVTLRVPRDFKETVKDIAIALSWKNYDDAIALLTKFKEEERTQVRSE